MCRNILLDEEAELTENAVRIFEKWKAYEEYIADEKIVVSKEQIEIFVEEMKQVLTDTLL
jgi:hypothetical protein